MSPYRDTTEMHVYNCELSIGLTHAASSKRSRIKLAIEALSRAVLAGIRLGDPRRTFLANELLSIVGGAQ